jgi:hypothetical protein
MPVNAGITASKQNDTRSDHSLSNARVIADALPPQHAAKGRTAGEAARLVGCSRPTSYRHQQALAICGAWTGQDHHRF